MICFVKIFPDFRDEVVASNGAPLGNRLPAFSFRSCGKSMIEKFSPTPMMMSVTNPVSTEVTASVKNTGNLFLIQINVIYPFDTNIYHS